MENVIFSFMSYIKGLCIGGSRPSHKGGGGGGGRALAVSQTMRQEGPITIFFVQNKRGPAEKKNTN